MPRNSENDELDEEELEELNRSTATSTFLEKRWWRWLAGGVVAVLLFSVVLSSILPFVIGGGNSGGQQQPQRLAVPDFTLPSASQGNITLSQEIADHGYVVLVFYGGFSSTAAQGQMTALQTAYAGIRAQGAEVLAVSVDSLQGARQMAALAKAGFPVLSDADHTVSSEYGLYNLFGDGLAAPAVFVLRHDGSLVGQYVGQNANDYMPADSIVALLQQANATATPSR